MKTFIPAILFYGNKKVCMGFVWWFWYALLLLKSVILEFLGDGENVCIFPGMFFKNYLKCEKCLCK